MRPAAPATEEMSIPHAAEVDEAGRFFCRGCEAGAAPDGLPPVMLWFEVGDLAELTFDTGETIQGLWTRPRGTHAGWVLTDGTRLRARPRTLVHIRIVYPPDRIAEESVTHDDHTTEHPAD